MELELQRRASSSVCSSGLFSLNVSETRAMDVNIDRDAGYTCKKVWGNWQWVCGLLSSCCMDSLSVGSIWLS